MSSKLRIGSIAASLLLTIAVSHSAAGANERLTTGGRHIVDGRPAKAKADLETALKEFRQEKNATGEAVTRMLLAIAEVNLSNPDAARDHLQNALTILRQRKDALGTWLALVNLAQMERAVGNYGAALTWQDEAKRVTEKAESSDDPLSLAAFELLSIAFGLPTIDLAGAPTGMSDLVNAIIISGIMKPLTSDGYAGILIETGQYDRAEAELNAALSGSGLFAEGYRPSVLAHFGELRYRQRRFAEARVYYEDALTGSLRMFLNPVNEHRIKLEIYSRLAELEIAENRVDEALLWNDKSFTAVCSAELPLESKVLEERGVLLLQGNRLSEAEDAFRRALEVAIQNKDALRQASIESHFADLSFLQGKYGEVIAHLEEAIRLQQLLNHPATEGLLWANLAVGYMVLYKDDSADMLLAHARELAVTSHQVELVHDMIAFLQTTRDFRRGAATNDDLDRAFLRLTANPQFASIDIRGDTERTLRESMPLTRSTDPAGDPDQPIAISVYAGLAYSNLGWRELENGNTTAAREFFQKALGLGATGELRARYQVAIGACHWRDGNVDQARDWFSEAAKTLDLVANDLRGESMLVSFLGSQDHRAYYDVLIEALLREHHDEKAFEVTERARARGFLRAGNGRTPKAASTAGSLAEKASEIRLQIENWARSPVAGETLDDLRLRYDLLRSRIESTTPGNSLTAGIQPPLSFADIDQELPDDTTLISYFVSPMGAHAWVLDREGITHVRLDLNPGRMQRVVCWANQFVQEGKPSTQRGGFVPGDCGSDAASSEEVYAALFAPLRDKIRNPRLMIVPHGDLHYVPFAALYDPKSKRYLIQDFTLVNLPSASALRLLHARESPVLGCSLVMGDPDDTGPTQLEGANLEVESVAKMLRTDAKLGKDAMEDLVYDLDGEVDLVHIAAHGRYDPADPFFSVIELAASKIRNGSLTVDEILTEVDLSGVNLVVLSACQSGIGKRSGGDDVVGLTRALLYAGTPGVVSTLWSISDKATTFLMEKFYARLLAGSTAADALRAAQRAMIESANFRDPYYWAAFLLTGDPAGKWPTLSH